MTVQLTEAITSNKHPLNLGISQLVAYMQEVHELLIFSINNIGSECNIHKPG